jgi:hypothetical protein
MKKIGIYFLLAAFGLITSSGTIDSNSSNDPIKCNTKALKKEGISLLNPYYYSSSKVSVINYDDKQTRKEIEVPLFKGEKYRLIFNKTELPKDIEIRIYDKSDENEGRSPIFSSNESEGKMVIFEPKKSKPLYVNYIIPAGEAEQKGGCIVFVLGYQLTFITDKEEEEMEAESANSGE